MIFSQVSKYISRQVSWVILLVLLVVISLDSLSRVIEQTNDIRENYNFVQLLYYVLLTIPGRIVEYMPYAALIGSLAGMGILANNNELVVMRAAGLSMWRLITSCLLPVVVFMLVAMFIAEFVVPRLDHFAEKNRLQQRYATKSLFAKQQFWNREKNEFMRIDHMRYDGSIIGLNRYLFDDNGKLIKSIYAERAEYRNDNWQLYNVKETLFGDDHLQQNVLASAQWQTQVDPRLLEHLVFDPEDLNIKKIAEFTNYLQQQELNVEHYKLAFWEKVFYPLTAIGLVLIAISGIFGSMRQKSVGHRIFTGVMIGVIFRMIQNLLTPAALVYDLSPLLASLFPIAVCFVIGMIALKRVH